MCQGGDVVTHHLEEGGIHWGHATIIGIDRSLVAALPRSDSDKRMVRACHEPLTADESRDAKPGDLRCSTPRKANKRRPRASLRALTHAER